MTETKRPLGSARTPSGHAKTASGQAQAKVVSHPIEGRVAAILNELQLAINRGRDDGVTRGMRFEVLEYHGVDITDPDTGVKLGIETATKIKVRVVRVEKTYSVAQSDEDLPGSGGLFAASLALTQPARKRTLRTDEALFPPLKEEASYVKRGDRVREIQD